MEYPSYPPLLVPVVNLTGLHVPHPMAPHTPYIYHSSYQNTF